MTVKSTKISPLVASVLIGAAALLILLAGYFVLVRPQGHKAAQLSDELAKTEAQIVTARALATTSPEQRIRVADLFKVVEAMPDDTDMTGIMLQLQQTARESGVRFDSITAQPMTSGTGFSTQPVDLTFNGNYYSLTDFLFRLRKLVGVHHGRLDAAGRLFSVGRIDFAPGEKGFPRITATVQVNAYSYSPATAGTVPPVTSDGTTTTTTTPSGAVASGANP